MGCIGHLTPLAVGGFAPAFGPSVAIKLYHCKKRKEKKCIKLSPSLSLWDKETLSNEISYRRTKKSPMTAIHSHRVANGNPIMWRLLTKKKSGLEPKFDSNTKTDPKPTLGSSKKSDPVPDPNRFRAEDPKLHAFNQCFQCLPNIIDLHLYTCQQYTSLQKHSLPTIHMYFFENHQITLPSIHNNTWIRIAATTTYHFGPPLIRSPQPIF